MPASCLHGCLHTYHHILYRDSHSAYHVMITSYLLLRHTMYEVQEEANMGTM